MSETFSATVLDWDLTKAKTGTVQFWLKFEVDLGDSTDGQQKAVRQLWEPITMNTVAAFADKIKTLGYTEPRFSGLKRQEGSFSFLGKSFQVTRSVQEYQGKAREKWQISRAAPIVPVEDDDLEVLNGIAGDDFKKAMSTAEEGPKDKKKKKKNATQTSS